MLLLCNWWTITTYTTEVNHFSPYHSLSQDLNVCPLIVWSGQRAVEIFPDVHRVIARLKSRMRGTHTHVSGKHLKRYLVEFAYRFNR